MLDPTRTTLPTGWAIEFVMALRSRDVTGAAIGDALRAAEAFCADSGQTPQEAFGPAAAYADSLTELPTVAGGATWTTRLGPTALGLIGLLLALPTFDAWRSGTQVSVSVGVCASALVIAVIVGLLVARPRIYRSRSAVGLLLSVGFVSTVLLNAVATQPALRLPVLPCTVLTAGALLGSGLWQQRVLDPDLLVDPLSAPEPQGRVFRLVTAWLFPLLTLLALGVGLLLPAR